MLMKAIKNNGVYGSVLFSLNGSVCHGLCSLMFGNEIPEDVEAAGGGRSGRL